MSFTWVPWACQDWVSQSPIKLSLEVFLKFKVPFGVEGQWKGSHGLGHEEVVGGRWFYKLNRVSKNSYVEVLTLHPPTPLPHKVNVFGDKDFNEVTRVKWSLMGGPKPI